MKNKMLTGKLIIFAVLACFLISLFASACEPAQTAAPSPTPAKPEAKSKNGGIFKIAMTGDALVLGLPSNMNAQPDVFSSQACIETLARYDETGNLAPLLAEKWVLDDKTKTFTITLRKGVKFHDGTDFNAKACKWNIDTYQAATKRPQYAAIASIDIVDDYTIRLNLSTWDNTIVGILVQTISFMISPAAYEKNGKDWCINNPVGTGPFKFVSWQRDVKQVFEKFTGYWQKDKPYLDRIEFIVIADPMVQLASLQRGEVDAIYSTAAKDVAELQKQGKYNVADLQSGIGTAMRGVIGDSIHPSSPFNNVKVRQAITSAIDGNAINQALFYGYGRTMAQLSAVGTWSYNPTLAGFPYNPSKAKELLVAAGFPNGFKTKIYCRNDKNSVDLYTAIQGYLNKVGIDASLEALATARQDQMSKEAGWSDGLMQYGVKVEADTLIPMYRSVHSNAELYKTSILHFNDIDKLLEQAITVPDFETKQSLTRQLQQLIFEKYTLFTPILTLPSIAVKSMKVHDDKIREIEETTWRPENIWIDK